MKPVPLVLWLVIYACESVGWRVERSLHEGRLTVTEDGPHMTRKPRRWRLSAEELSE